jgi:hypothetical protein
VCQGLLIIEASLSHIRRTTLGRTPLDEGPARRRDLYLTTHNTYKRQTSMPTAGFEPAIPASERPQTQAIDRAATGIGDLYQSPYISLLLITATLIHMTICLYRLAAQPLCVYRGMQVRRNAGAAFNYVVKFCKDMSSSLYANGSRF